MNESNIKVLTPADVAEILHVTIRTVMKYLKSGTIPAKKISRRWVILEDDLKEHLSAKT